MKPAVVFPDIVALLITHLRTVEPELDYDINQRPPGDGPLIVMNRNGGVQKTLVSDEAYVDIDAWAPDAHDGVEQAHDAIQRVRSRIRSLTGSKLNDTPIYHVGELAGPARLPDPENERDRWNCSLAVSYRGTSI